MSFDAAEPGTPERAWRAAGTRRNAAPLDIGAIRRLVVLAAHPDDETLAAGGLVHAVASSGRPVAVVVATFGEASHPDSPSVTSGDLAAVRQRELAAAVAILAPDASLHLLALPDGGLRSAGDPLEAAVRAVVRSGDTVVAPWRHDGHPDHEALGAVAARVTAEAGAMLLEAPIWAWHWGSPQQPWPRAVRFDLAAEDGEAKRRAIGTHRSQIAALSPAPGDEALLHPAMLEHFSGPDELFFASGAAAVDFDAMYAVSDDPWGFAERWYERRKRALTLAALPAERYERALEIGSSIGLFSEAVADRVGSLLAIDVAARAVELARARLADLPGVRVEQRRLPLEWPDGTYDLILFSETGFYFSREELIELSGLIAGALEPGGVLVLCHWRPHVAGLALSGDEVHELLRDRLALTRIAQHLEDDFVLEVLQSAPAASVAQATGLR